MIRSYLYLANTSSSRGHSSHPPLGNHSHSSHPPMGNHSNCVYHTCIVRMDVWRASSQTLAFCNVSKLIKGEPNVSLVLLVSCICLKTVSFLALFREEASQEC